MPEPDAPPPPADIDGWFARRGWPPSAFQRKVWAAAAAGESGLLHATTGAGKTYAVWFAVLSAALAERAAGASGGSCRWSYAGLKLLWITPMRALASDTARALAAPVAELGVAWPGWWWSTSGTSWSATSVARRCSSRSLGCGG